MYVFSKSSSSMLHSSFALAAIHSEINGTGNRTAARLRSYIYPEIMLRLFPEIFVISQNCLIYLLQNLIRPSFCMSVKLGV
jgi:hypothetical protein